MLHITISGFPQITKHFGKHPFQGIVAHGTPFRPLRRRHGSITIVTDIERSTVTVATLFRGIHIVTAQFAHVLFRAEHRRDNKRMEGDSLYSQRIKEIAADTLKKFGGLRHQVWNGAVHALIHRIKRIAPHIYKFLLTTLGLLPVGHRRYAPLAGRGNLYVLQVGETFLKARHAVNAASNRLACVISETGLFIDPSLYTPTGTDRHAVWAVGMSQSIYNRRTNGIGYPR